MNTLNYGIFALTCKGINIKRTDDGEVISVKWAFTPGARPERKFTPDRTPLLLRAAKVATTAKDTDGAENALRLEFTPRTEEGHWLEPVMLPCQKTGNLTVDPEGLTIVTTKFTLEDLEDIGFGVEHILGEKCSICLECNPNLGQQDLSESAEGLIEILKPHGAKSWHATKTAVPRGQILSKTLEFTQGELLQTIAFLGMDIGDRLVHNPNMQSCDMSMEVAVAGHLGLKAADFTITREWLLDHNGPAFRDLLIAAGIDPAPFVGRPTSEVIDILLDPEQEPSFPADFCPPITRYLTADDLPAVEVDEE